jgi:SAM-dependent methyltransferase
MMVTKTLLKKIVGQKFYENLRQRYKQYQNQLLYFIYSNSRHQKNYGYNQVYYQQIETANQHYYSLFAQTIIQEFHPSSLVDVGCGAGGISLAFMNAGCSNISAFDYSSDAVEIAKSKGLPSVQQIDLTKAELIPAKGDICICLEVAEHIPEAYAKHLCKLLSEVAPIVILTAAPPGQGGHLHVNEKPQSYWIEMMNSFSLDYDAESVARIRRTFDKRMLSDYDENLMIFQKKY